MVKKGKHMQILGPVDTAFLYVDSPQTPMNIGALTIFEGQIAFDQFIKLVDTRIPQIPLYMQRIIQAPFKLGQPTWAFDPEFHVSNHVFEVTVEPPGTDEQLRELAGHLVSGMLDRNKPLWEIYLISGLADNRTGIFFKVHHCMVDGLSAVELFTTLLDLTPEIEPFPKKPVYDPPYLPSDVEMVMTAIRQDLPNKLGLLQKLGSDALKLGNVLVDKEKRRKALIGMAYLLNDNLRPIRRLAINGQNSGKMALAWAEFSLAEVRAIRSNRGASVNDVMLTVLVGAVERYLKAVGDNVNRGFLRVLVPVSMRDEEEKGSFGNRISVLPVDIPFGIADPLERLAKVAEYTQVMKQSALTVGLDMVLTLPSLLPSLAQPLVWNLAPIAFSVLAHTWCTNVAGPQIPVYLLGHKMLHSFGYFPLNPSMGLACVIVSYNQRISMTIVADAVIIPEVADFSHYLEVSFTALRRAAKVPEMEPVIIDHHRGEAAAAPAAAPVVVNAPASAETKAEVQPEPQPIEAVTVASEQDAAPIATGQANGDQLPAEVAARPSAAPEAEVLFSANGDAPTTASEPAAAAPPAPAPETASVDQPALNVATVEAADSRVSPTAMSEVSPTAAPAVAEASVVEAEPAAVEPRPTPAKPKLFSEEWAQAYREAINNSKAYYDASTRWEAGALAFVMKASPKHGFMRDTAVLLDLHKGVCREARSLRPEEAMSAAAFLIEGEYPVWMEVLSGRAQPLMMIVRGKLRLRKGSIAKLMPFTQSAQELIHCAQSLA